MNFYTGNRKLNEEEKKVNAYYIYVKLLQKGWTANAICGLLGNVEVESYINPGIWQGLDEGDTLGGYGLVQWTPATKYLNWCSENNLEPSHMDSALARIEYEKEHGIQFDPETPEYTMTFDEFTSSTDSPYTLGCVFAFNYEKSWVALYGTAEEKQALRDQRGGNALKWYEYLTNGEFPIIPSGKRKKHKYNFLLFKRRVNIV